MEHEIASSVVETDSESNDTRDAELLADDNRSTRSFKMPPSRSRPSCCKHATWCKIRSNIPRRRCCEHTPECHNSKIDLSIRKTARTMHSPRRSTERRRSEKSRSPPGPDSDTRTIVQARDNQTPMSSSSSRIQDTPNNKRRTKRCISKKNRERDAAFRANKHANHAALTMAFKQVKKELKKEKKAHRKTKSELRHERCRRRRAEADLSGKRRKVVTSSSSSSETSSSESEYKKFFYVPQNNQHDG